MHPSVVMHSLEREEQATGLFLSFRPHEKETIPDKFITLRLGTGGNFGIGFYRKTRAHVPAPFHRIIATYHRASQQPPYATLKFQTIV